MSIPSERNRLIMTTDSVFMDLVLIDVDGKRIKRTIRKRNVGMFLQWIIANAIDIKPIRRERKFWYKITTSFLKNHPPFYTRDEQVNFLRILRRSKYVQTRVFGKPPERHIWINLDLIEEDCELCGF